MVKREWKYIGDRLLGKDADFAVALYTIIENNAQTGFREQLCVRRSF